MRELPGEVLLREGSVAVGEVSELTRSIIEEPLHGLLGALQLPRHLLRLADALDEALVRLPAAVVAVGSIADAPVITAHEGVCCAVLLEAGEGGLVVSQTQELGEVVGGWLRVVGWLHLGIGVLVLFIGH